MRAKTKGKRGDGRHLPNVTFKFSAANTGLDAAFAKPYLAFGKYRKKTQHFTKPETVIVNLLDDMNLK
jgi:hypothetical protein